MMRRSVIAALLLSVPATASEAEIPHDVLPPDECEGNEADCALNALQFRGAKVSGSAAKAEWGSCATYGCNSAYVSTHGCQCNSACLSHGNCCSDFSTLCHHHHHHHGSCAKYGCGTAYVHSQSCQCNAGCLSHGNCCSDYDTCSAKAPATPPTAPTSPAADVPGGAAEEPTAPAADEPAAAPKGSVPSGKIYGHPTPGKAYPEHPGYTLMLVEEFEAPIDLDSDPIWTWSDGGLIEGQIRFAKSGIQFGDGKMKVVVSDSPATGVQSCSDAEVATIPAKPKTSGEMRTKHNMFRYGRYEARMKAPSVQPGNTEINGNYVSTMFVFRDAKYKHWREIDFEITGDGTGTVTTNVLSADNTNKWRDGIQESVEVKVADNVREEFHDYAFEWTPTKITWYIDGKVVRTKSGGGVRIPDLSGKIMMNLWMFDHRALFGGPDIQNNRYPMHSEYEWFRFYKWDGDTQYPCAGMGTSCLTPDDKYLAKNNPCDGITQTGTVYGKTACITSCR